MNRPSRKGAWPLFLAAAVLISGCPEKHKVALTPANLATGATEFQTRCAMCHGKTGAGDGPMAGAMPVKPRNLRDPAWQAATSDTTLDDVIARGGKAIGKRELMPGFYADDPQTTLGVRAYVRSLAEK